MLKPHVCLHSMKKHRVEGILSQPPHAKKERSHGRDVAWLHVQRMPLDAFEFRSATQL